MFVLIRFKVLYHILLPTILAENMSPDNSSCVDIQTFLLPFYDVPYPWYLYFHCVLTKYGFTNIIIYFIILFISQISLAIVEVICDILLVFWIVIHTVVIFLYLHFTVVQYFYVIVILQVLKSKILVLLKRNVSMTHAISAWCKYHMFGPSTTQNWSFIFLCIKSACSLGKWFT